MYHDQVAQTGRFLHGVMEAIHRAVINVLKMNLVKMHQLSLTFVRSTAVMPLYAPMVSSVVM